MNTTIDLAAEQAAMRARQIPAKTVQPIAVEDFSTENEVAVACAHKWTEFLIKQTPGIRPEAKAIVLRHAKTCKHQDGSEECECSKWMYVRGERERFPLFVRNWAAARERVKEYCDRRDVKMVRELQRAEEWDAEHSYQRMLLTDGIQLMIQAKLTAKDTTRNLGRDVATSKIATISKHFFAFLDRYNRSRPSAEPIRYFDQITTGLLQDQWRPTWPARTFNTKFNYRTNVIHIFHYAMDQHWMPDTRKLGGDGKCQCVACRMLALTGKGDVQSKLPFNMPDKVHTSPEWQMRYILDACKKLKSDVRPHLGQRLAALIEVGSWGGARISDTSLMARSAVDLNTGSWTYQPLKTRNTSKKWVTTQLPPHVCQLLRELPAAADSDPDYFFWTGKSLEQNAADPWHDDLSQLWALVDKRAGIRQHKNDKGQMVWGIRDPKQGGRWSKVSFHSFRNTFAVRCRMSGMSFARIGELIGDTEQTVKDHYAHYTEGVMNATTADLRQTWPTRQHEELVLRESASSVGHVAQA
jgi:hypothetical protein